MQTRSRILEAIGVVMIALPSIVTLACADDASSPLNIALAATPATSFVSGHELLSAICDGFEPRNSADHRQGAYGNWPRTGTQWIEYEWPQPISTNGIDVYWWDDNQGVRLPTASRLSYWDGSKYVPISTTVGVEPNRYNSATFPEVTTTKLRLEIDAQPEQSSGVSEWKVWDSGKSPAFPPIALAGDDRVAVMPAPTYLEGSGKAVKRTSDEAKGQWTKSTGPGDVTFAKPKAMNTSATFTAPGEYELMFSYGTRGLTSSDTVKVKVEEGPKAPKLNAVYVASYKVDSPFWKDRLKAQIVNWIPHCVAKCDDPNVREGGINNLIEAGKKLRGEPAKPHVGYPFSNAWVLNTAEAMCVALTVDPQGDAEIIKTQNAFKTKLDEWIPIILAAQEKDGYFQTRYTLGTAREQGDNIAPQHWDPRLRTEHEGYIAGYFIEMGIAHHIATGGKDRRLYDAALKLADCWVEHIGPAPKKPWYDGHQEVEQALVRLGRYVNDLDGAGKGQKYIDLAKFLLDSRSSGQRGSHAADAPGSGDFYTGGGGGDEYDQSHRPIAQQYTAVGHAVRAAYTYSAMADIAMETGDPGYWSATRSIWDNIVNKKYYVTGGIGSGETSEGFGPNYSLPSGSAYVESCSSCGLLYMQYKLNVATRDAKYADLYETTLYNAILGDIDLDGQNFTYTNSLDSSEKRYKWHVCPCCVGNIPRTLLMLPTWMYATSSDAVFVNLYAGTTVKVGKVAGAEVEMVQNTDYPWKGAVAITVNPSKEAEFTINVRSPRREVSELYQATPHADGITSLKVNGEPIEVPAGANGYVAIKRTWKAGDKVELELPLPVQTITPSDKIAATKGRIAIRRGPLVYNIETADKQNVEAVVGSEPKLAAEWASGMLGGVMLVKGTFADGASLIAVPNYARLNRGGRSLVWMKQ
jgi:uncharacterized protein